MKNHEILWFFVAKKMYALNVFDGDTEASNAAFFTDFSTLNVYIYCGHRSFEKTNFLGDARNRRRGAH